MDTVISTGQWRQKQQDQQRKNRETQKRHVLLEGLPSAPKEKAHEGALMWLLPDSDRTGAEQHVTEEWNRIQWELLKKKSAGYEGESIVWAMNMIATLQGMWVEATDELEEMRRAEQ